jgi:hypothetical protein
VTQNCGLSVNLACTRVGNGTCVNKKYVWLDKQARETGKEVTLFSDVMVECATLTHSCSIW